MFIFFHGKQCWKQRGGCFFFRSRWKRNHTWWKKTNTGNISCVSVKSPTPTNQEKSLEIKPSDATWENRGTPPTLLRRGVAPEKKTEKKMTIVQTWNELNAWWVFHVMILSCIQRFFHVFHGFKVLHPKKIPSFPRSVFFHPFRNWPVLTWATEHRMVASFFFKAGYVENLRWTVAGESVVMFHHASTEEFGGPTAEVCLAFLEPFCWKRNWWCFEVRKNKTIPTSETRWWTGTRGLGITEATTLAQDSVAINSTKTFSHIFPKHVRESAVMW